MIGQYLSNKNESATIPKTKKFLELSKALVPFFLFRGTVALSFLFSNYYPIMD